jgi:glycosyltransferase involved in cell wall biosynthesis
MLTPDIIPFFSVIVPVYNRANLLKSSLTSVIGQTFGNFEIIVVDDGSDDHPEDACREMGDTRIRLIRQSNGGASSARNRGIDQARGRYIAFLDSDDRYLPNHLESLKEILDHYPDAATYSQVIADRGEGRVFVKPPRAIHPGENMAMYLMCDRGFVQTSGLCLPADVAKRVRYREDAHYGDDTDFAIRLQLAGCTFVMCPQPTILWADDLDHDRLSDLRKPLTELRWLEDLKLSIPAQAYHAYRGWHLAKSMAQQRPLYALTLFLRALLYGAYGPRLAGVVFMQIALPNRVYRRITNLWIRSRQS